MLVVELDRVVAVRVSSLGDIARLASTLASRMLLMPVYRFRGASGWVYALQTIYKDYYRYYGVPIVYYYVAGEEDPGRPIRYILARADETGERVELSDRTRTGWIAIPVINLEEKPGYMPDDI